jgi:8-oxo-dGTP pyrophosphatase MutT (NUDIX family)
MMAKSKRKHSKSAPRQVAAIPVRLSRKGKPKVLLLTSRRRGRWIIPKGWLMEKLSPADAAAREAYEEGGIKGRIVKAEPIGRYRYRKSDRPKIGEITVQVFLMRVKRQLRDWPEQSERRTRWVRPRRAAAMVEEPELALLLARVPKLARPLAARS